MEERNVLTSAARVTAPPGFERRVLAELARRKETRQSARRTWRFAYAGAAAVALTAVVIGGFFFLVRPAGTGPGLSDLSSGRPAEAVPVLDTLDYSSEYRNASAEPGTVYILEQVSEVSPREITY